MRPRATPGRREPSAELGGGKRLGHIIALGFVTAVLAQRIPD
jgi:hypothetical protein